MDIIIHFLSQYGYWGMLLAAFLAGSFFPFSSEAVMVALMATGLDPWTLMIYGTIGNVLGSILNYSIGRMGKMEWIEKYLHVKKNDLEKAHRFLAWCMDGILRVPPSAGKCHNDSPGIDALQYLNNIYRHHTWKDFPLYNLNLRRRIIHIADFFVILQGFTILTLKKYIFR